MYELRVLSGLHRGATLPVNERPHSLGSSEDADVVLVDPGVEGQHASLSLTGNGWSISSLDGSVLDAHSNKPQTVIDLAPGEFARIGNVWLTVVEQNSPWENPPPEPDDVPEAAGSDDMISVSELQDDPVAQARAEEEATEKAMLEATAQPVVVTKGSGKNSRRLVYISMAVATVLSAAAYAITSKTADDDGKFHLAPQLQALATGKSKPRLDGPTVEETATAAAEATMSPDELRQAFRKRLADAELLKRFDLDLGDQEWNMKAALDDEEAARFERVLASFVKTHKISFPVHAKVGSAEAMLPFKIRQVVTGSNAGIVTDDGTRIYVGDEYKGMRLAAVSDNRVTFTGKRKIEVKL